jgi:hypothetical protein
MTRFISSDRRSLQKVKIRKAKVEDNSATAFHHASSKFGLRLLTFRKEKNSDPPSLRFGVAGE